MSTVTRRSSLLKHIGASRTVEVSKEELKLLLKTEVDQSLDMVSEQDGLSSKTRAKLLKMSKSGSGVGPVKISVSIDCGTTYGDDANKLEFLGHVGTQRVLLNANSSERYHGLLILGDKHIV